MTDEIQKWEKLLQEQGLGMGRGYNSRKLVYGYESGITIDMKMDQVETTGKVRNANTKVVVPHCRGCNHSFVALRADALWCSDSCRVKTTRKRSR